uniref:Aromatic amino acid beta-eliminating lyase/threonine aldolase domain-containing protein n=1 Tax=Timema tahoe TaxID=61484 RepID=A0A7R9NVK5_9NEOP|nr:unnamed protein product [Timema tahoe]
MKTAVNTSILAKICIRHYGKRVRQAVPKEHHHLPIFQYPTSSDTDQRVYVWGLAEHGALGNQRQLLRQKKPQHYVSYPKRLHFAEQNRVLDATCGYGFSVFSLDTKEHYKVFGTGLNTDSQIGYHAPRKGNPLSVILAPAPIELPFKTPSQTRVTRVAAGRAHLMVLTDKEGVFTLGNNAYGQCGRRIVEGENYFGNQVVHRIPDVDGASVKTIVCGQDHSLIVSDKGEVFAFGWGADGQTGLGHFGTEWRPSRVVGDVHGENIVKVACAADCVLALSEKGEVFGWGNTEYGQLNNEQQVNSALNLPNCRRLGKIRDIAAGGTHCMVLNEDGEVFVWGYGILGVGPQVDHLKEPTRVPRTLFGWNEYQPDTRVKSVTCGLSHSAAVTNHGDLFTWGRNRGGCLGLGHTKDQFFPLRVAIGARVKKRVLGQWLSLQRSLFNSNSALTHISNTPVMTTPTNVRVVDLRSDTLTKPTQEMRRAMFEAEVGDDVYGEDPTVNALEKKAAAMLNKEGGLFLPSATMSNLVALMSHCKERGCEVIAGDSSHIFLFEQGGAAQLGGVQMCTLPNKSDGTFDLDLMESKVRSGNDSLHEPITSLICVENTHNVCGGKVLPLDWLDELGTRARGLGIPIHMDGARLFNAAVYLKLPAARLVRDCASVSICMSKGLGAPVGALLLGNKDFIQRARRVRKVLGGGMRQAGVLAAAGLVALDKMVDRLELDHRRAADIAKGKIKHNQLSNYSFAQYGQTSSLVCATLSDNFLVPAIATLNSAKFTVDLKNHQTNILFININSNNITSHNFCQRLATVLDQDPAPVVVKLSPWRKTGVRLVTYHEVNDEDTAAAINKLLLVMRELQ